MVRTSLAIAAAALGLSAGVASAATVDYVYAQEVTGYRADLTDGYATCSVQERTADRFNLCNALGEEDHPGGNSEEGFLSAGNYDALKFTFGGEFAGPVDFFEITFNRNAGWVESIAFLLTGNGGATFANLSEVPNPPGPTGDLTNTGGAIDPGNVSRWILTYDKDLGPFNALWVFDTSSGAPGAGGGFDIDAIRAVRVSEVPLPAAGFLLLAGLGGLALMRRRAD